MVDNQVKVLVDGEPIAHQVKSVTLYDYDPPYTRMPKPEKRQRDLKPHDSYFVELDKAPPAGGSPIVVMYTLGDE